MKKHVTLKLRIALFLLPLGIYLAFGIADFGLSFQGLYWLVLLSTSMILFFGGALVGYIWGASKVMFSIVLLVSVTLFVAFDYFYYDVDFTEYSETPETMELGLLAATIITFPLFLLIAYLGAKILERKDGRNKY